MFLRVDIRGWLAVLGWCLCLGCLAAPTQDLDRLRYIVETDAGGDPDDEQSFVRFLLYANEWDVEGIIANRPKARDGENLNSERTGLGIVRRLISAYGQCYTNLILHDPRYPSPGFLLERTVSGYADSDEGVRLVISALERADARPVWFSNWGTDHGAGPSCLKRALDRILQERGPAEYAKLKARVRLSSADAFGEHTSQIGPPWSLWVDTFRPEQNGKRWYHRFSALTADAGGFDVERDVRTGHGPLGALYPTNTTHPQKEGDSMSFIYLIPNGLNYPDEPGWGGWAGRYGPQPSAPGKYYWANQSDAWHGSTNRDNTLLHWAGQLQNDFRARVDWCVKSFKEANHPPHVTLNHSSGTSPVRIVAAPGSEVVLDASESSDPDGQQLSFDWFTYPEVGSYEGTARLSGDGPKAILRVPSDAEGKTIHIIVAATDSGWPRLTRYRRAVISVRSAEGACGVLEPFFHPPTQFAGNFGGFRSPLVFEDGSLVKGPADWPRRRREILREWAEMMGPWPPLLESPKLEILGTTERENIRQERIRLQIGPDQTGEGWLLTPQAHESKAPAVLVVYYEPETSIGANPKEALRDFGYQLAKRGFVTLSIGTPGGNAWKPETRGAPCQPLSYHAYVAANCWQALANLPQVDASRIGIVGHSYGGKWAMFAGALWEKFAAVAVSDPGIVFDESRPNVNYWEPWYLGFEPGVTRKPGLPSAEDPRTGAYKRMVETGHDLQELHALIAPRPFFVSGGAEDRPERWLALNHLVRLNTLLGFTNRVAMTNRETHAPTEKSNEQLYAFFECFLGGRHGGR